MRAVLIVNPVSGWLGADRARVSAAAAEAVRLLGALGVDLQVRLTERPAHATALAAAAIDSGADRVLAWGGDGTINEVAESLAGTAVVLGIIPGGSGNGLARELRVPLDARRALRLAAAGAVRTVDVGELAGRIFLNVAGVGFDAQVAEAFDAERKGRRGLLTYARITVRELRRYEARPCRVIAGDEVIDGRPLLVAIANSAQYGNGARVAPGARLDDGLLDVVVVEAKSFVRDMLRARRLFTGTLARDPWTTVRRAANVRLESEGPRAAHVDGQPFQIAREATATVRALALRVVVPGAGEDLVRPSPGVPRRAGTRAGSTDR